jgi:hypothetical protein
MSDPSEPPFQVYMQWAPGEFRVGMAFQPVDASHPTARWACVVCGKPIGVDVLARLVVIEPLGGNPERHRAPTGGAHWACLGDLTEDELEEILATRRRGDLN